jgi:hypothetical protein
MYIIVEDSLQKQELVRTDIGVTYLEKVYFDKSCIVPFWFEKQQKYKFIIRNEREELTQLDVLLSDIVSSCSQGKSYPLTKKGSSTPFANLYVYTEEVKIVTDYVNVMELQRRRSVIRDLLAKTPKFITQKNFNITFEFPKVEWDEIWIFKCYDSHDIMCYRITTSPIVLQMQKLNNNRQDVKLRFIFLSHNKIVHQEESYASRIKTTPNFENVVVKMDKVQISNPQYEEFIAMAESAKKRQYREYTSQYSFLDYLTSGVQLDLIIAIDFTISNGFPNRDTSLHYIDPDQKMQNEYVHAIEKVGKILEYYDHDGLFPVYGFGGVYKDKPSHCFPLREEPCRGIDEVIKAYKDSIQTYSLSAPTNFAEIIKTAKEFAQKTINGYYILLIITSGLVLREERDCPKTVQN